MLPLVAVGLLVGQALPEDDLLTALLVAGVLAAPTLLLRHRRLGTAALLLLVPASIGRAQIAWEDARRDARLANVAEEVCELHGRVVAVRLGPSRGGTRATLDLELRGSPPFADGERVRLTVWSTERTWRVGESVRARASPRAPRGFCNQGTDGYARWCWRSGIVALASVPNDAAVEVEPRSENALALDTWIDDARTSIGAALERAVTDHAQRSILRALVLGDQREIPRDVRDAYARTGTAHVLSVSGLHIALVATSVYVALAWLLARWPWLALRVLVVRVAALAAIPPALAYTALSGGAVATLRALAMAAIGLGAVSLVRRPDVWTALAAAAIALALSDPGVASEASFQLSFASVAALVVAGERLQRLRLEHASPWLAGERLVGRVVAVLLAAVVASLAATLATAPLTAFHFGSVALVGVVANLVVVPLVGWLALLLGLVGATVSFVSPAVGEPLLWLGGLAIAPANRFVAWLAAQPWCALDVSLASPATVIGLLALLVAARPNAAGRRALLALAAIALAAGLASERPWRRELVVRFLDVGQGDAALVVLPGSAGALLIDAGGLGGAFDTGERVVLPALRRAAVRRLDALVLSHPDFDHYGGMAAVARGVRVAELWSSGRRARAPAFEDLLATLHGAGARARTLARGDVPSAARAGAEVAVLHPPAQFRNASENDASLVLRVTFGATRVLFTGDVEEHAEAALAGARDAVAATVLKVPHHGSRTSSTRAFLAASRPSLAVAMLGWRNRFGFPAPAVRERHAAFGAAWRETAAHGEVVVVSDGQLERVRLCR